MSSSLYQPRPMLSSQQAQRYASPAPDYVDARRSSIHSATNGRVPLRESNGNAQSHNFNGIVSCYQSPVSLSPSIPGSIQAPMVPSQSFDSMYRVPTPRQQPRYQQRKPRADINPLYFWPAFRQYRNRQAHKDTQKDKGGVWRRPELEDAFVDSVLLMPHMGRRKFSMGGKLHGRNMLISEYIFVLCIAILGSKEIFRIDNSNDSIEQMGRKQVSSHMQVVKKFFEDLRCFHFLFPSEEKREPGSTNSDDYYDDEEQESFKSNPILTALAEGRVPDVKPNYPYFSQLLALQSYITVRPKTCDIFVSSSDIKMRNGVAYDSSDVAIDRASFPHLNKYTNPDDNPRLLGKDMLLHEYTRVIDRVTSACVKTVTRRWQKEAPALYESLELPKRDEECLLLEMCATLDLHEHAKFPSGSELTGFVEVAVTHPALQNHRWKCVTRMTRPTEFQNDDAQRGVYTNETGIHRHGCSDSSDSKGDCDCHTRPRQEIHVPFPAVEWAGILSMAVQYPDVEHQRCKERRQRGEGKKDGERAGNKRKRSEDECDAASWSQRELTGSDLICKVAMYQELWSRAPDSTQWTRQAIVFWRFNTTNQWYKYEPVFKPAGTSWRWLTMNDPMSKQHQQRALVFPPTSRDNLMSPTPTVNQHLTAAMNETFNQAWDNGATTMPHVPTLQTPANTIGLFDSFSGGLATPPPSASIQTSYSHHGSFDSAMGPNSAVSFVPPGGSAPGSAIERHGSSSLASGQYFDVHTTFADAKPVPAPVNTYNAVTASLDLTTPVAYDTSSADAANLSAGWDMSALDSWAGPSPSTAAPPPDWGQAPPKVETNDTTGMWTTPQWNVPASLGAASISQERGGSPRPIKRQRADGSFDGHVPATTGW